MHFLVWVKCYHLKIAKRNFLQNLFSTNVVAGLCANFCVSKTPILTKYEYILEGGKRTSNNGNTDTVTVLFPLYVIRFRSGIFYLRNK